MRTIFCRLCDTTYTQDDEPCCETSKEAAKKHRPADHFNTDTGERTEAPNPQWRPGMPKPWE